MTDTTTTTKPSLLSKIVKFAKSPKAMEVASMLIAAYKLGKTIKKK